MFPLIHRPRKLRMASFMDSNGSLLKEINIQRKSINGSQVSACKLQILISSFPAL